MKMSKVTGSIKTAVCGFFMALADSVPGVSGGTVAFFAGEYDDFICSFGNITGRDKARRRQSLLFLLRLGIGWICGMGLSVTLLAGLFNTHIYAVSSLFSGLVAASIPLVAAEEKKTLKACRPWHILFFFAGAAVVVALSLLHFSVSTEALDVPSALYVFVSGALAISAMVLPGISGSTLLLAFGLYVPIITAMKRFFAFDLSALPLLLVFGFGVLAGIFCSFRGIHYLLSRHRGATVCAILGLMSGSLFAVAIEPTTLKVPLPPLSPANAHPVYILLGAATVAAFAAAKAIVERRAKRNNTEDAGE